MEIKDNIVSLICEAFGDMDETEKYEIGNGYYMVYVSSDNVFYCGVAVGKLDEDNDFVEDEVYLLDSFSESLGDILTSGELIIDSMAQAICEEYDFE